MKVETLGDLFEIVHQRYGNAADFIERIRATLDGLKLSQAALAREAGIDPCEVSRWMNGRRTPNLENRLILDEALMHLVKKETGQTELPL